MSNTILKALGLEQIPPGITEYELTCKILRDPALARRSHDLMVEHFSELAILKMSDSERAAFIKKLVPAPVARVSWNIGQTPVGEQWFIRAVGHSQEVFFTGKPEAAHTFKFLGETCPPISCIPMPKRTRPWATNKTGHRPDILQSKPLYETESPAPRAAAY